MFLNTYVTVFVLTNGSGRQHQSGTVKDHSYSHLVLHLLIALIMETATRFISVPEYILIHQDETVISILLTAGFSSGATRQEPKNRCAFES